MSSKTDLMYEITYNPQFTPQRSPKVKIKTLTADGKKTYVMRNHLTSAYYDVDEVSKDIWSLIDGQRTVDQIRKELLKKWPEIEPETAKEVILFLAEVGCLKAAVEETPKKKVKIPSAFEVDVVLIENSKTFLERVHRVFHPLLKTPLFWGSLVFIVVFSALFAGEFTAIFADAESFRVLGSTVVGFFFYSFIVLGPTIAIHEIAHGLALVHYGGVPGEIGTGLFYFGPMFYIDATDSWTLGRRERIMVMMAGNISTLLIASAIVAVGYIFPYPSSVSHLLYMTAFFCFYATLMNLAPPFETDGYYVLADLVNIPTLRQESYGYVKSLFKKAFGMRVEKRDPPFSKKKTLVGFALLSVGWIVYTVFQTTLFTLYMAGDAQTALQAVYSAAVSLEALSLTALVVSLASVLYFGMTLTGYGVILVSALKRAAKAPLKVEAIHDRDLSMFFYVPPEADSAAMAFERRVKGAARHLSQNPTVTRTGSMLTATLQMGGTKLALNQIGTHLRSTEQSFGSLYQDFLEENIERVSEHCSTNDSSKPQLVALLSKIADEIAEVGITDAKSAIKEMIERQERTSMHLLNSAYGSVWTIELPPSLLHDVAEHVYPSFFVEDFATTNLYGETEEFKKRIVYGFDTLSRLSSQDTACLHKAITNPEEFQVLSCFEPIMGRLLFVGRTEHIERDIPMFGALLIGQTWCGYMDSLLSEVNLTLLTLRQPPELLAEEVKAMSDGELFVLSENLSTLSAYEKEALKALDESEKLTNLAKSNVDEMRRYLESKPFKIGALEPILAVNEENLTKLPNRMRQFRDGFKGISLSLREIGKMMKKGHQDRVQRFRKRRRKMLYTYPPLVVLSSFLVLAGLLFATEILAMSLHAAAVLLQVAYWATFYSRLKGFRKASRYPSHSFVSLQLYALAFAQAIYRFVGTYSVITPTEVPSKSVRKRERKSDT